MLRDELTPIRKLLRARIQLQDKAYFIYSVLCYSSYRIATPEEVEKWEHKTAYANALGDIAVAAEYIEGKTDNFVEALLYHEVVHLVLMHPILCKGRIRALWNIACFKSDALIGERKISEIREGDVVLDKTGRRTSVTATSEREYKGQIISIKPHNMLEIEATEEHPFLVRERKWLTHYPISLRDENQWKKAGELAEKKDYLVVPKIVPDFDDKYIDLSEFVSNVTVNNHSQAHNVRLREFPVNEDTAWFLGLYVAEGSDSAKDENFCFSLSSLEDHLVKGIKDVNSQYLGYSVKVYNRRPSTIKVLVTSAILSRAFKKWCGRGAKNKMIPNFILYHKDQNILKAFLRGVVDGDGHIDKMGYIRIGTSSRVLAQQLQQAYCRTRGVLGSLCESIQQPRELHGRSLPQNPFYTLVICHHNDITKVMRGRTVKSHNRRWKDMGDYILTPIVRVESEEYEGKVYNIETGTHSYVVDNVAVHNCDIKSNQYVKEAKNGDGTSYTIPYSWPQANNWGKYELEMMMPDGTTSIVATVEDCNKKSAITIYDELYEQLRNNDQITSSGVYGSSKPEEEQSGDGSEGDDDDSDGQSDESPNHDGWDDKVEGKSSGEVTEELRDRIRDAYESAQRQGTLPDGLGRSVGELLESKTNWKLLLQNMIVSAMPYEHSYRLPDKRSYATGVYMPHVEKESSDVIIAIDTSASIVKADLTAFLSEIVGMSRQCHNLNMEVIVCDAAIHEVYPVRNGHIADIMNIKVLGGGGTSHIPVYEYCKKRRGNAKLLINFTDGFTSFPDPKDVNIETLWVLTENSIPIDSIPFGRVIRIGVT